MSLRKQQQQVMTKMRTIATTMMTAGETHTLSPWQGVHSFVNPSLKYKSSHKLIERIWGSSRESTQRKEARE